MATNDFLVVAPGPTPNVASQATYAADPIVTTGNVSGVAKSAIVNKAWRQSSIIAAVVAQYIADVTGANSVDDGTTTTLLANFKLALGGKLIGVQKFTANGTYTPTAGTKFIIAEGNGGGGGGGGTPATAAGQRAVAHGGQCGGYARARYTSGFTGGLAVLIGAPGAGGAAGQNVGVAGGTTSLGSILSIPGGSGGNSDTASTSVPTLFTSTTTAVDPTVTGGVLIQSVQPVSGTGPFALTLTQTMSGCGGDSFFGRGGRSNTNGAGLGGLGSGSGGSGAGAQSGLSAQAGGSGAPGILIIYEFG